MKKNYIYLDNNATTKLDPIVLKEMLIDLKGPPYNPSSSHFLGKKANCLLIEARKKIASLLEVKQDEVIFTSGATEAINMLLNIKDSEKKHIITSDIEHSSVYNSMLNLEKKGFRISFLKAKEKGRVDKEDVEKAIQKDTKLVFLSSTNSETGVMLETEKIASMLEEKKIPFIVDAVATLSKEKIKIEKGITAMVFSAHKIHGPKGIGCAFIRSNFKFSPLLLGGIQEYKKRAGTENLAGILGFKKAFELAFENLDKNIKKMKNLRDSFEEFLLNKLSIEINGKEKRICNVSNIFFKDITKEELLIKLNKKKILASHSSACNSITFKHSRVLLNMLGEKKAKNSIRFSFSRFNTMNEVKKAAKAISYIIQKC